MMAKALDANGAAKVFIVGRRKENLEKVAKEAVRAPHEISSLRVRCSLLISWLYHTTTISGLKLFLQERDGQRIQDVCVQTPLLHLHMANIHASWIRLMAVSSQFNVM